MQPLDQDHKMITEDGLRSIEDEHAPLAASLKGMRDMCGWFFDKEHECTNCKGERMASCQGLLPSFAHDILELTIRHFENEEAIMAGIQKTSIRKLDIEAHKRAHLQLLRELEGMLQRMKSMNSQGLTAKAVWDFHQEALLLSSEHTRLFDNSITLMLHEQYIQLDVLEKGAKNA